MAQCSAPDHKIRIILTQSPILRHPLHEHPQHQEHLGCRSHMEVAWKPAWPQRSSETPLPKYRFQFSQGKVNECHLPSTRAISLLTEMENWWGLYQWQGEVITHFGPWIELWDSYETKYAKRSYGLGCKRIEHGPSHLYCRCSPLRCEPQSFSQINLHHHKFHSYSYSHLHRMSQILDIQWLRRAHEALTEEKCTLSTSGV